MCNLSGYIGKNKGNILSLKILALQGALRGTDSTGFYFGNQLLKFTSPGDSRDILNGVQITQDDQNTNSNIFMCHNRSRTIGSTTEENAHPYEYDYIKGRHIVFMHNGTIKNIAELCKKYNIDHNYTRTDSYFFGKLLYEQGTKILSEYEGFAAIACYDVVKEVLYLFKGYSNCELNVHKEERPLFIYQKRNGLYFNSTEEGLITALNTSKGIIDLAHNIVYTIDTEGKIINQLPIDRNNITFKQNTYNNYGSNWQPKETNINVSPNNGYISSEANPQNQAGNRVYFFRNQYYRNGHIMNDIFSISGSGYPTPITEATYDAYVKTGVDVSDVYFFYKGFMIKDYETYKKLKAEDKLSTEYPGYTFGCLIHPQSLYLRRYQNSMFLYHNNVSVNETFVQPLFSFHMYKVLMTGCTVESTPAVYKCPDSIKELHDSTFGYTDKSDNDTNDNDDPVGPITNEHFGFGNFQKALLSVIL